MSPRKQNALLVPLIAVAFCSGGAEATAQPPNQDSGSALTQESDSSPVTSELRSNDPHVSYAAGDYARAAELFAERAERRPNNAQTQLNLGSSLHELGNYDAARAAFGRALESSVPGLKAKAAYDLGNTAYRQGRLDEAIGRYKEALALAPDDEDAKFNLEFVQREKQRRQEQAQQRQQQQDQQSEQDSEQSQDQQGKGEQSQQSSGDQQQSESDAPSGAEPRDSDGDGLSDELERSAENPTDPNRSDSDGDGRRDGDEDANRNGRVDPGESDPNRRDEAPAGQQEPQQSDAEEQQAEAGGAREPAQGQLSEEEAERLLAALEDRRPPSGKRKPARTTKKAKDW